MISTIQDLCAPSEQEWRPWNSNLGTQKYPGASFCFCVDTEIWIAQIFCVSLTVYFLMNWGTDSGIHSKHNISKNNNYLVSSYVLLNPPATYCRGTLSFLPKVFELEKAADASNAVSSALLPQSAATRPSPSLASPACEPPSRGSGATSKRNSPPKESSSGRRRASPAELLAPAPPAGCRAGAGGRRCPRRRPAPRAGQQPPAPRQPGRPARLSARCGTQDPQPPGWVRGRGAERLSQRTPPPHRQPLTGGTVRRYPPAPALPRRPRSAAPQPLRPTRPPGQGCPPRAPPAAANRPDSPKFPRRRGPSRGPRRGTAGSDAHKGKARGGGGPRPPVTPARRGPPPPCAATRRGHPSRPPLRPCRCRCPALPPAHSARGVTDAHGGRHLPSSRPDLTGRARRPRPPGRTPLRAGLPLPYAASQPASLLRPQPHQPPRRPAAAPAPRERSPGSGGARPPRLTAASNQSSPAQHRGGGKL
ncbi:basic proline-rich protein-like [Falco naumanni]|uniref:basic proline-rich protein-like n=1 Tax=Falco naumanni TaxID=148594 RepID=UPI001ADE2256|nr:basic proline-rich protein-like [Falco naumanni]